MAKLLKLRRGTTTQHSSFTGAEGEVTVDTDKETLVVHDGSTAGGHPVAAEDLANVSSSTIAGRLSNDSIAVSKIAAGTLPSDVKIQDANVSGNLTIATADINADAVNGSKIADDSIDSEHYVDGSIDTAHIANSAVTGAKILNGVVDSNKLGSLVVTTAKIAADAVTGAKIADDSINSEHYVDGSIDRTHLSADLVDGSKIADDSINSEHYVDGSIDTAHIANSQITTAKIANDAVDVTKMLNFPTQTILGRETAGTGNATTLSASQVRGILNVENGATADQSNAEIRAAVEAASDSNVFTDADHSKLNGIEASATADQTASEIVSLIASQTIAPTTVNATNLNSTDLYATGKIGRDSNDYITWTNNSRADIYVNGNNEFRFESDGDFHADGDVIAFSTTISSDAKLKEDIKLLPNALDKIEKLNGVTFKWKRDGAPSAGVIAQDVQKVLPEAVKEVTSLSNGEKHLSVNYHALTSILIESIKELKAEIEQLKGGQ